MFGIDVMALKFGSYSHQGGLGELRLKTKIEGRKEMSTDLMHFKPDICGCSLL